MKVAIFGASGLVGRNLGDYLTEKKIEWIGTYNKNQCNNSIFVDITKQESISQFLLENNITHCVNSIAERNVDLCEKQWDTSYEINCRVALRIATACKTHSISFLHISTDYVFNGNDSPYSPTSIPEPIQSYGRSKQMAEEAIQNEYPSACILRVPVLYTKNYKNILETAVTMIGKKVMDRCITHKEDNYFIRRPVFIEDMIVFVVNALQRQYTGIYHFYNPQDKTTKYNMACIIGKFLDKPVTHIEPINMPISVAGRPFDTQLVDPQYNRDLFPFTPLEKGIEACFQQFKHPLLKQHVKPSESIFYLFDLDGTLLDTEKLHYECYKQAFEYLQIPFCSWLEYQSILAFDEYCKETCGTQYEPMKQKKNQLFYSTQEISFLPGAKLFLQWLLDSNQNFVIVTNTSYKTIEFYKQKQPLLQRVLQWVARDDVQEAKPNPESYKLAKEKYYKNETYTIGFENTMTGYFSIQSICPIVYLICEPHTICYSKLYDRDIYFIRNFEWTAE